MCRDSTLIKTKDKKDSCQTENYIQNKQEFFKELCFLKFPRQRKQKTVFFNAKFR